MAVRAKFTVVQVEEFGPSKSIKLMAIYDSSIPEDQRYSSATPFGELRMTVDNPAAAAQFEKGKTFYLDFVPVAE